MNNESLFELRRRTFDTPHFRGIEFIEVEAKSIINHVPGSYLPFNWTINPYRGCSHACSYCLSGDTPILMSDGGTKPLREVRVGDQIYGTERSGSYRRYVVTPVLAHWSTVKAAYRVTLADGTQLIASADHRFLTGRGWKYVTGAQQGSSRRPHLTVNDKLIGIGGFEAPPQQGPDYKRGYLCGLIRGDGHIGSYAYQRPGRLHADVHRFRLALVDIEALRRARSYLIEDGVVTRAFLFQEAVGGRKAIHAIRASALGSVDAIRDVISWPPSASEEWHKGFLAGIFDAEGSYSRGILRIANTNAEIIERITTGLSRFRFSFTLETASRGRASVTYVRIVGGLREHLRFFHTVDPAITRKRTIEGQALKSNAPLGVVSVQPLGIRLPMFDMTTGTGDFIANGVVSHNCFARVTHTYMDMNAGRDFDSKIVVKVNAGELLPRELRAKRWKGEHIAMGTATDPYQRAEGRYKLMPKIISTLTEYRNPFSILTKGTLIVRDLDLLVEASKVTEVSTALSIGTLDEVAWSKSEPGTPHPRKRIQAVAKLNGAGIPCGVMVAPVLPGITDDVAKLRDVVKAAVDAGATHVSPILLHLRPTVKEEYMAWLRDHYPELVPRHEQMYARSAYAPKEERKELGAKVSEIVRSVGGIKPNPRGRRKSWREQPSTKPAKDVEQLKLL